jgi:hypothetical protein
MAGVEIKGLDGVKTMLAGLSGELKTADKSAQTELAKQIRSAEQDQMRRDLDRPKPWSLSSVLYKQAGVTSSYAGAPRIEGAAIFWNIKFGTPSGLLPEQYLGVQIEGGVTAGPRRSEKVMQDHGWMPKDRVWVPAAEAPRDQYGNVPGGYIASMLTSFGAIVSRKVRPPKGAAYILIGEPGDEVGVFRRVGGEYIPFLWFVPRASYKKRFDFYGRGDQEVIRQFPAIYRQAVDEALQRLANSSG